MDKRNSKDNYIAGKLQPCDWYERKKLLVEHGTPELWAETFQDYFHQRLSLRYLEPIRLLQSEGTFQGEGFSIVTIQCALIEFLAATKIGKNYRHIQGGQALGEHEYSRSRDLFTSFLIESTPFSNWFGTIAQAQDFYANVRCALVHEARTKSNWRIWATGGKAIDFDKKIVKRDSLQAGIENYIQDYGVLLTNDTETQDAFIRKFDHLAAD